MPGGADREASSVEPVIVGKLVGLYGVQGWFRVRSYTDPPEALLEYPCWLIGFPGNWQEAQQREARRHGKGLIARLGIAGDRDSAAQWLGAELAVPRESLTPPGADEYYWSDLVGLRVRTLTGRELGKVDYLIETGSHDVLVVKHGAGETLIPFVPGAFIREVNLPDGPIVVDWEWD